MYTAPSFSTEQIRHSIRTMPLTHESKRSLAGRIKEISNEETGAEHCRKFLSQLLYVLP
jgi:hypothetical protein